MTACIWNCHDVPVPTTSTISTGDGDAGVSGPGYTLTNIDAEVNKCIALRRHRNTLAPVSQLPPEILNVIFRYCVPKIALRDDDPPTWIQFTHVCHLWREIALKNPALWVCPQFSIPDLAEAMLARSQKLPLHIVGDLIPSGRNEADGTIPHQHRVFLAALAQLSRTEKLDIETGPFVFRETLLFALVHPAPLLKSLTMRTISIPSLDLSLHPGFLGRTASALRQVRLEGFAMNWLAPTFQMVSHLRLADVPSVASSTWNALFDGLEGLRHLETLDLHYALPGGNSTSISGRQLSLRSVRDLRILDAKSDIQIFLTHMKWTACPTLRLTVLCEDQFSADVDPSHLLRILSKFLHDTGRTDNLQGYIGGQANWSRLQIRSEDDAGEGNALYIQFPHHDTVFRRSRLDPLWAGWAGRLETVSVHAELDYIPVLSWDSLFSAVPKIHTLYVIGTVVTSFLDALEQDRLASLQILRTLYLHNTGDTSKSKQRSMQSKLRRVFSARHTLQLPLRELHHWGSLGDLAVLPGVEEVVLDTDDPYLHVINEDWSDDDE